MRRATRTEIARAGLLEAAPAEQHRARQVAHNYAREHRLNMWFVLATETPDGIEHAARAIERACGLNVLRLPKERTYTLEFKVAA
jgi:hypothetical protein